MAKQKMVGLAWSVSWKFLALFVSTMVVIAYLASRWHVPILFCVLGGYAQAKMCRDIESLLGWDK